MPSRKTLLQLFFIISLLIMSVYPARAAVKPENEYSSVINNLRNGGYILYIRHGDATVGQDQPNLNFNDCSTQRNLSETGKKQAQAIGQIFNKLKIPINYPVLASPYCRVRESASLAFGSQNVKVIPSLADIVKLSNADITAEEKQNIIENLTKMLEIAPPNGFNQIIIGHSFPADTALGEIPSMGTVIIKPKGQGNGYEIVKKISLEEFEKL